MVFNIPGNPYPSLIQGWSSTPQFRGWRFTPLTKGGVECLKPLALQCFGAPQIKGYGLAGILIAVHSTGSKACLCCHFDAPEPANYRIYSILTDLDLSNMRKRNNQDALDHVNQKGLDVCYCLWGCHPDARLGPILGPSRSHPGSEVVPSRFAMCFVLQCFGPIQVPRWGHPGPSWSHPAPERSLQDRAWTGRNRLLGHFRVKGQQSAVSGRKQFQQPSP